MIAKKVLVLVLTILVSSAARGGSAWFEAGSGVTFNSQLQRYELTEHTTTTVHVFADFAVSSMDIGAITAINTSDVANQGVLSVGSLHPNLVQSPFFLPGQLKDGSDANKNIVIFQVRGGFSIIPGEGVPAPAGEALYSFDITAGLAGTTIDIDDLTTTPQLNPFGFYPLVTNFTSTGPDSTNDISTLKLFVTEGPAQTITLNSDGSGDYPTIQQAIDAAKNGDTIILADGIYTGPGNREIDFKGKAVTLRGANGPADCIIDCQNAGRAFHFHTGENPDSVVEGVTIRNGYVADGYNGGAIYCQEAAPTIKNCIFTGNTADAGGAIYSSSGDLQVANCTFAGNSAVVGGAFVADGAGSPKITNSIFWDNTGTQIYGQSASVSYTDVQGGCPGQGNIDTDPSFADAPGGDFHLKSVAGRFDPPSTSWLYDAITSPCIDAGNPGCPLGDEPQEVDNTRINMGAYGGTDHASGSPENWALLADLNNDGKVDFTDYTLLARNWSESAECVPADLDLTRSVDFSDLALLVAQWLAVGVR